MQGTQVNPWSGNIPRASGQLSLCTTATEVHALQQRVTPHSLQLEKATKIWSSKNNLKKKGHRVYFLKKNVAIA